MNRQVKETYIIIKYRFVKLAKLIDQHIETFIITLLLVELIILTIFFFQGN